jgi:hypothetical protein
VLYYCSFIDQILVTSSINKDLMKPGDSSTQTDGSDPISLAKQFATALAFLLQKLNSHLELEACTNISQLVSSNSVAAAVDEKQPDCSVSTACKQSDGR